MLVFVESMPFIVNTTAFVATMPFASFTLHPIVHTTTFVGTMCFVVDTMLFADSTVIVNATHQLRGQA